MQPLRSCGCTSCHTGCVLPPRLQAAANPIQITAAASSTTTTSRARWLFRSPRVQASKEQCGWSLSQYCGTARSCSRQLVAAAQSRGGVQHREQLRQLSPRQPVSKQRRKVRACSGGYRFARKGLCPMFCQNSSCLQLVQSKMYSCGWSTILHFTRRSTKAQRQGKS